MGRPSWFHVLYRGEHTLDDAERVLGRTLAVERDGNILRVREKPIDARAPKVELRVSYNAAHVVVIESQERAEGYERGAEVAACDRRFEVRVPDIETALDDYNTLFRVEEALQHLTKGWVWMGWNGELIPPHEDSLAETIARASNPSRTAKQRAADWVAAADLYAKVPDLRARIEALQHAHALVPWDGYLFNMSIAASKLGALDESEGYIWRAWRADRSARNGCRLVQVLVANKKAEAALGFARVLAKRFPDHAGAAYAVAEALEPLGRYEEALEAMRRARALAGKGYGRDLGYLLSRRANQLAAEGAAEQGRACIVEMVEVDPSSTRHLQAALYYQDHLAEPARAETHFRKALEIAPGDDYVQYNLGVFLRNRGAIEESVALLRASAEAMPASSARCFHLVLALGEAGRAGAAEAAAFAHLKVTTDPTDAYHALGHLYLDHGRLADAEAAFRAALAHRPTLTKLYVDLAAVELARGQPVAAQARLDEGLAIDPSSTDCQRLPAAPAIKPDPGELAGFVAAPTASRRPAATAAPAPRRERISAERCSEVVEAATVLAEEIAADPVVRAFLEHVEPGLDLAQMTAWREELFELDPEGVGRFELPLRVDVRGMVRGEELVELLATATERLRRAGIALADRVPRLWPTRVLCEMRALRRCFLDNGSLPPGEITILDFYDSAHQVKDFDARLEELPAYTRMEWMRGWRNDLTSFPQDALALPALRYASLSHNSFTTLPAALASCPSLQVLDLKSNPVRELPADLGAWRGLRYLDLRKTELGDAQIATLREALPGCLVEGNDDNPRAVAFDLIQAFPRTVITGDRKVLFDRDTVPLEQTWYTMAATARFGNKDDDLPVVLRHDPVTDLGSVFWRDEHGIWRDVTATVRGLRVGVRVGPQPPFDSLRTS